MLRLRACACAAPIRTAVRALSSSPKAAARLRPVYNELAQGAEISRDGLGEAIRRALPDSEITDSQVDAMFNIGDRNDSGTISFEEFLALFDVFDEEALADEDVSVKALAEHWIGLSSGSAVLPADEIFDLAWRTLAKQAGGPENVRLPREILFLGGAPDAARHDDSSPPRAGLPQDAGGEHEVHCHVARRQEDYR